MWGWLDSLASGIKSIWESIQNLSGTIVNGIVDRLSHVWDAITSLASNILNGIKEIFIPDLNEIEIMFNNAINSIKSKFGFQDFHFDAMSSSASAPADVEQNYNINGIGSLRLKFFDAEFLIKGVEFFRPFIRGFIVLCLLFYNYRMFLSFIGHNIGVGKGAESNDN